MKLKHSVCCLAGLALLGCGVGTPDDADAPLSYEAFKSRVYVEPDTGVYVLNLDEIAETEDQVRDAYLRYLDSRHEGVKRDGLIVNTIGGVNDKWSATAARNITYCVSSSSFGSRYSTVVAALNSATAAWEGTANVNFVHSSTLDSKCTRTTTGVVFNVRMVSNQAYLARAFFPSTTRSGRELLIDSSSFGSISPWTLTGILRHELGHALGLRHEHTRPESGTCYEDSSWRALTAYDASSVMHYPQCNGTQTGDLVLTQKDKDGARLLYP